MNQPRKTKKIEIEIYEEEEVDFLLSLINSCKTDISKEFIVNNMAIPYGKYEVFVSNAIIPTFYNTRKKLRRFWVHFKEMSKHKNAKFYDEIVGNTFNSFFERKISATLFSIYVIWCVVQQIQNEIKPEDKKFILASISDSIFNHYLKQLEFDNSSAEEKVRSFLENDNYLKNEGYKYSKKEVNTPFGNYTRNEIYNVLEGICLYIETGQKLEDKQDIEFDIMQILYQELKRNYDVSNYATNIVTGFVLAELGFLKSKEELKKEDSGSFWKDYLRTNVENKIRNKMAVDKNKITFIGEPLLDKTLRPNIFFKEFKSLMFDIILLKRAENKAKMSILSE